MNFTHYDLGSLNKGRVVEVHLTGNAANVYLMDTINFAKYKKGMPFQAIGGLSRATPIKLQTANSSVWHLVVDLPNGVGTVKTAYRVLTGTAANANDKLANFKPSASQKNAVSAKPMINGVPATVAKARAAAKSNSVGKGLTCTKCGKETMGGKFCPDCGHPLDKVCPGCSTISANGSKFCLECGMSLL